MQGLWLPLAVMAAGRGVDRVGHKPSQMNMETSLLISHPTSMPSPTWTRDVLLEFWEFPKPRAAGKAIPETRKDWSCLHLGMASEPIQLELSRFHILLVGLYKVVLIMGAESSRWDGRISSRGGNMTTALLIQMALQSQEWVINAGHMSIPPTTSILLERCRHICIPSPCIYMWLSFGLVYTEMMRKLWVVNV